MKNTLKKINTTALGIALFVVLSLCIQVPVFENYYICLGYVVMAVFCYYFGAVPGMVVGSLGVVIYCLITHGLRGMPGWALGNLVIGFVVGVTCKYALQLKSKVLREIFIIISVIISTGIGMLLVKSFVECLLYAQPMEIRMLKNIYAFVADAVVLVASIPLCNILKPMMQKAFPEMKGDA